MHFLPVQHQCPELDKGTINTSGGKFGLNLGAKATLETKSKAATILAELAAKRQVKPTK